MALFSFKHSVKTFSKKAVKQSRVAKHGQTLSHIRYITRDSAARNVLIERLPAEDFHATAKCVEQAAEKSGGRVCERFTVALPLEASEEQRTALIGAFAEHITKGKAGYIAAIHDKKDNDVYNPHSHLICFDTFTRKGGRGRPSSVLGMARNNAVENAARDWATIHNRMMTDWGYGSESLIDYRSYADRGIDQIPTIHEGPAARKLATRQTTMPTKPEWQHIDQGHTRAEANKLIKEINKTRKKLNEQRTDRLGSGDDANPERSEGRVPWLGENGGSGRGYGGNTASQRHRIAQGARSDCQIPSGPRNHQKRTEPPFPNFPEPSPRKPSAPPPLAARANPNRRWSRLRRVRRTFRELVMYRDTFQARLLRNSAPRRFLKNVEALTHDSQNESARQSGYEGSNFSR